MVANAPGMPELCPLGPKPTFAALQSRPRRLRRRYVRCESAPVVANEAKQGGLEIRNRPIRRYES